MLAGRPVPALTVSSVWHHGDLDPAARCPSGPLEGHCLSVAADAESAAAWVRIARLGGRDRWRLDGPFLLLDHHRLDRAQVAELETWALELKLVEAREGVEVSWHDDELEQTLTVLYLDADQAARDHPDATASPARVLTPRRELTDLVGPSDPALVADHLAVAWAEQAGYDGIFFNDALDPERLSAPRGGLYAPAVARACRTRT